MNVDLTNGNVIIANSLGAKKDKGWEYLDILTWTPDVSFKFDRSWEWLMPVVGKVQAILHLSRQQEHEVEYTAEIAGWHSTLEHWVLSAKLTASFKALATLVELLNAQGFNLSDEQE